MFKACLAQALHPITASAISDGGFALEHLFPAHPIETDFLKDGACVGAASISAGAAQLSSGAAQLSSIAARIKNR